MAFLWILVMLGSTIGGFFVVGLFVYAKSAPQEASMAATAVAFAVIPYVFTRAFEGLADSDFKAMVRRELGEIGKRGQTLLQGLEGFDKRVEAALARLQPPPAA
jgi:uncharacterized alpha/beta hydrolase family protein